MQFVIATAYIVLYYLRPFEFVPLFKNMRIMFVMGIVAAIPLVNALLTGRTKLFRNGIDQLMLGFLAAIILSHLRHLYFGGALNSLQEFWSTFVAFYVITHCFSEERHFETFINVLILCSTYLAIEGIVQAHTGTTLMGDLEPLFIDVRDEFGDTTQAIRIKWTGYLMDPNDLALAFVIVVPFLIDRIMGQRKLLATAALVLLFYAIFLTNSRGGMLALLFAVGSYFILRYKSLKGAMVCAIIAVIIFVFGPSRMAEISATESSAYGRLMAWYQGFQMFKQAPLFGVGHNFYTMYHDQVAHNSYVHVLAELGLFGLFFYIGLLFFPLKLGYKILFDKAIALPAKLTGQLNAGIASMVGLLMAMFFLSRAYILLPYVMVAYLVSLLIFHRPALPENSLTLNLFPHFARQVSLVCIVIIVYINLILKLFL